MSAIYLDQTLPFGSSGLSIA